MLSNIGSMAKQLVAKGAAVVSVKARKRVAASTRATLNKQASDEYNATYRGNTIFAPMTTVVNALEYYAGTQVYGWRRQPSKVWSDGRVDPYILVLDTQDTYLLGQLGCPVQIHSPALGIHVNMIANQGRTEAMVVQYRFILEVDLTPMTHAVYVSASMREMIDPGNHNHYLRSGQATAPSRLGILTGAVSERHVLDYLHGACEEARPDYQTWFDETGSKIPHLALALEAMYQAERELLQAEEQSKKLGWLK